MIDPSAPELERLAWKYATLAELRRARARGEAAPEAPVFKALAREFPGCLNELDTLPLDDLDARAAALAGAANGGAREPWMAWLAGYHALLRAALWLKPRLGRDRALDDDRAGRLAADASAHAGTLVDAVFVRSIESPPGGRMIAVVLAQLEARHDVPAASIKRALFPRSKR